MVNIHCVRLNGDVSTPPSKCGNRFPPSTPGSRLAKQSFVFPPAASPPPPSPSSPLALAAAGVSCHLLDRPRLATQTQARPPGPHQIPIPPRDANFLLRRSFGSASLFQPFSVCFFSRSVPGVFPGAVVKNGGMTERGAPKQKHRI